MKIAFLTPEYPHFKTGSSGGIGTSIKILANGLLVQGCSVRVLVYGQHEDAVFEDNGVTVQKIQNVKFKGLSWWLTQKKMERIINKLYESNEIHFVEAPDWTGITSFIQPKKCPVVIRLNGSDTYFCHLDNRPVKWINKFHEKRALQKADALLSVSQFTAELTNKIFGLNREFVIIPNAIDTVLFTNKESNYASITESKLGLEPNLRENTILYFGSLIRKKGVLELPFIFNQLIKIVPDAKLILVGKDVPDIISGNTSTWLMMQSLFTTAALKNVTYSGSVSYIEIQNKIKLATVCVFPSFAEALPVSWLEAMAMQKAIVTSNIGWAKEIIEDGKEGFLADPKKHFDFAMKISALLNNTILTIDFGKAAREKAVAKFDICVISYKNIEFYKSVFKVEK